MLRKLRIALAAIFFIGITLLFVGIGHDSAETRRQKLHAAEV